MALKLNLLEATFVICWRPLPKSSPRKGIEHNLYPNCLAFQKFIWKNNNEKFSKQKKISMKSYKESKELTYVKTVKKMVCALT